MNNNIYIYNNTFTSLLNLIDILLKNNIKPFNIKNNFYIPNLLDNLINLEIDLDIHVVDKYLNLVDKNIFKSIYYIFLSTDENKELIIYYFLLNSLKHKAKIIYMRNLKCVDKVLKISNYVSRETHKLKGFTRFRELENKVLYAEINPENNVLELLSNHFKNRLKNELWIIKDANRKIISIYDKNEFFIVDDSEFNLLNFTSSDEEMFIQNMWKSFYKTIGIKERKNNRCRMNFMPKKYWKFILEMSDEIEKSN